MTRICNWCEPEHALGEKCSKCGSEKLARAGKVFICRNDDCSHFRRVGLRHLFVAGEGGTSHGICRAAHERENAKNRAADAAAQGGGR